MLNRLSIRHKLTAMLMIVSSFVLLLASAAFVTGDFYRYRADMQADIATEAQIVLENTTAAVTFSDAEAAGETLDMLSLHPHSQLACLYTPDGRLFASRVFRDRTDACPAAPPAPGMRLDPNRMSVTGQSTRGDNAGARLLVTVDL